MQCCSIEYCCTYTPPQNAIATQRTCNLFGNHTCTWLNPRRAVIGLTFALALADLIIVIQRISAKDLQQPETNGGQMMAMASLSATVPFCINAVAHRPWHQEARYSKVCQILSYLGAVVPPILTGAALLAKKEEMADIGQNLMIPFLLLSIFFRAIPAIHQCNEENNPENRVHSINLGAISPRSPNNLDSPVNEVRVDVIQPAPEVPLSPPGAVNQNNAYNSENVVVSN